MNIRSASFFTTLVLAGSMLPVHAFDINNWFSSLSPRSKGAVYLTAAAMVAGVSYLAYKIWTKKSDRVREQVLAGIARAESAQRAVDARVEQQEQPVEVVAPAQVPPAVDPVISPDNVVQAEVERQVEVKEQVAQVETEWEVLKTFKLPETIFSVAVGKDARHNVIILAGGMSCVYRIDTTTGLFTRLALPAPRLVPVFSSNGVAVETPERIDALKIISQDQFVVLSKSHVRLCDMQGNILDQIEDTSHSNVCSDPRTYFDGIDAGIDKAGKLLIYAKKYFHDRIATEEAESIRIRPFGDGRMVQIFNHGALVKSKTGDLKIVYSLGNYHVVCYDPYTGKKERTVSLQQYGCCLVIDEERVINHTLNDCIQMSSLKDGHCLYEMPRDKWDRLSGVVNADGHYITADVSGAIKIWDIKNQTRKTIAKLDMPVESSGWRLHCSDFSTFQSLDLNRRALGNYHFVSAAKDGTVKLWAHTEKAGQEAMDASIAKGFFEYLNMSQPDVQSIIHGYVGSDAEQAFLEIRRDKELSCAKMLAHKKEIAEEEENRLNRLSKLSKEVGLD